MLCILCNKNSIFLDVGDNPNDTYLATSGDTRPVLQPPTQAARSDPSRSIAGDNPTTPVRLTAATLGLFSGHRLGQPALICLARMRVIILTSLV